MTVHSQDNPRKRLSDEKWHALEVAEIYRELQSRPEGLTEEDAADRLRFYDLMPSL